MKEQYTKPIAKVDEFKATDVVTTSGDPQPDDKDNPVWPWD